MTMSGKRTFAFDHVSKHDKTGDCWLILHRKVYDVSPFMEDHPGGSEVLLAATGKDATIDFEDIGHSDEAKGMMSKYYIGEVEDVNVPLKRTYAPSAVAAIAADHKPYMTSEFVVKILKALAPLFVLSLAFVARSYAKN